MITKASIRHFSFAGGALLSAAILTAQMPGAGGSPNTGPTPTPTAGVPGNMPEQTSMQNEVDQAFVRSTLENDEDQIRLSQLAEQKSTSPDVKQFSQQMVKIRGELSTQLQPVAKQLGVGTPKGPSKKEKKEIPKLQALSGPDFDTAYLENMGQEQRESLKQFHSEAHDSQNSSLRNAASQDTKALSQDYQTLQQIAQAHNIPLESNKKK